MRAVAASCFAAALLLCASGCAQPNKGAAAAKNASVPPSAVGTIATVNDTRHFVLIDVESRMFMPEPGAELQVRNDKGAIAKLKVTADRRWPFVVADIVSGSPAPGDEVFP